MKDKKRILAQFTFYDRTGIQKLLEKQAAKGWLLENITRTFWGFRRIEPQKINYAVTYFPEASIFDPEPTENQKRFWDMCQHTGWKLAANNAQLQIFYNENENPIPIETDPETELESIEKSAKKMFLPSYYILTACGVIQILLTLWRFSIDGLDFLSLNSNIFAVVCWTLMLALCLMEIIGYFTWIKKARKAVEETGTFTETKGYRNIQLAFMWFVTAVFAVLLYTMERRIAVVCLSSVVFIGLVSAIVWKFSDLLKKFKVSAKANRTATVIASIVVAVGATAVMSAVLINGVINKGWFATEAAYTYEYKGHTFKVYDDQLPLMVEDITNVDYDGYSTRWYGTESILLSCHDAYQRPRINDLEQPELQYTIVKVKLPLLYKYAEKQMLKDFARNFGLTEADTEFFEKTVEIDPTPWGANCAYQIYVSDFAENRYLLCYNECIIELRPDIEIEITDGAKATVGVIFG